MVNPGLIVLHGNRLEELFAAVSGWLRDHPLAPLEEECFLVQSQGMGEWLKMQLATSQGVCAAVRVELPARFLWRAYRAVLGSAAVPRRSPLDKHPLTWRLMAMLPGLLAAGEAAPAGTGDAYAPLRRFLQEPVAMRRLQLAQRLADLFDQYQVHRGDWLESWAQGQDVLHSWAPGMVGSPVPLGAEDLWQSALWRELLQRLPPEAAALSRPAVHAAFLRGLQQATPGAERPRGLPRRLVLFGTTHVPRQSLEAVAELAKVSQVVMAVPNPCRHYWADLLPDREMLQAPSRRHAPRPGMPAVGASLAQLAPHGHPLLAGWGRQSRDFIRLLDEYDSAAQSRACFDDRRVDLFDDGGMEPAAPLLAQVQARIRDLVPVGENPPPPLAAADRSIVFHIAHNAQREVEVLHDQLLRLFAEGLAGTPLAPREVVVMMPDVAAFEPAIRSVFGQHERTDDPRRIPYRVADLRDRGRSPLLVAVEWLLGARTERFTQSSLRALLEVPALQARFGLAPGDIPLVARWLEDARVRWGLHRAQRESLGLGEAGEQNSWEFGLQRLLLGYAIGEGHLEGIEASTEVGGLEAALLGPVADLFAAIARWWEQAGVNRTPREWALVLRSLLQQLFSAAGEPDRVLLLALDEALSTWLEACEDAGFIESVDLDVVREAWLETVDDPGVARRFHAGGVTFCTLLPLRAVPFKVVCLLGMNDGDYPRRTLRTDFDLMARPFMARPGDRSGRDDDRQLMLDALLSSRQQWYVSWAGRSPRDDSEQPPSVLVAQLRDYLAAVWGPSAVEERTTIHPLQPFSRRYFLARNPQGRSAVFTYAREWREAYPAEPTISLVPVVAPEADQKAEPRGILAAAAPESFSTTPPTAEELARFLQNPVREYFKLRLGVAFPRLDENTPDEEPFVVGGLEGWGLMQDVLRSVETRVSREPLPVVSGAVEDWVEEELGRLQRAGRLPLGAPGANLRIALQSRLSSMVVRWVQARQAGEGAQLLASRLCNSKRKLKPEKLLGAWVELLQAGQAGQQSPQRLVAPDGTLLLKPPAAETCAAVLQGLVAARQVGLASAGPLPTAIKTGLAFLKDSDPGVAYEGNGYEQRGEVEDPCLARLYPDYESLLEAGPSPVEDVSSFAYWSQQLYGAFSAWAAEQGTLEDYAGSEAAVTGGEADD